jgi:hypothetical protein
MILCLPKLLLREEEKPKVTFFEDGTGTVTNGTIWIKFNCYNKKREKRLTSIFSRIHILEYHALPAG